MITGIHTIVYNREAERLREFFREVFGFKFVDAGHGWLIFALPPAELGIHPTERGGSYELYLMCDDISKTLSALQTRGARLPNP